jgi:hypothetical protein
MSEAADDHLYSSSNPSSDSESGSEDNYLSTELNATAKLLTPPLLRAATIKPSNNSEAKHRRRASIKGINVGAATQELAVEEGFSIDSWRKFAAEPNRPKNRAKLAAKSHLRSENQSNSGDNALSNASKANQAKSTISEPVALYVPLAPSPQPSKSVEFAVSSLSSLSRQHSLAQKSLPQLQTYTPYVPKYNLSSSPASIIPEDMISPKNLGQSRPISAQASAEITAIEEHLKEIIKATTQFNLTQSLALANTNPQISQRQNQTNSEPASATSDVSAASTAQSALPDARTVLGPAQSTEFLLNSLEKPFVQLYPEWVKQPANSKHAKQIINYIQSQVKTNEEIADFTAANAEDNTFLTSVPVPAQFTPQQLNLSRKSAKIDQSPKNSGISTIEGALERLPVDELFQSSVELPAAVNWDDLLAYSALNAPQLSPNSANSGHIMNFLRGNHESHREIIKDGFYLLLIKLFYSERKELDDYLQYHEAIGALKLQEEQLIAQNSTKTSNNSGNISGNGGEELFIGSTLTNFRTAAQSLAQASGNSQFYGEIGRSRPQTALEMANSSGNNPGNRGHNSNSQRRERQNLFPFISLPNFDICAHFHPGPLISLNNSTDLEARLERRLADSYVQLWLSLPPRSRDTFLRHYYEILAQSYYFALSTAFPSQFSKLDNEFFKRKLLQITAQWTNGYIPSQLSHNHWQNPLKFSREIEKGSENSNIGPNNEEKLNNFTLLSSNGSNSQLSLHSGLIPLISPSSPRFSTLSNPDLPLEKKLSAALTANKLAKKAKVHPNPVSLDNSPGFRGQNGNSSSGNSSNLNSQRSSLNKNKEILSNLARPATVPVKASRSSRNSDYSEEKPGFRAKIGPESAGSPLSVGSQLLPLSNLQLLEQDRRKNREISVVPLKVSRKLYELGNSRLISVFLRSICAAPATNKHKVRLPVTLQAPEAPYLADLYEEKLHFNDVQAQRSADERANYGQIKVAYRKLMGREQRNWLEQQKRQEVERIKALREAEKFSKGLVSQYQQEKYAEVRPHAVHLTRE